MDNQQITFKSKSHCVCSLWFGKSYKISPLKRVATYGYIKSQYTCRLNVWDILCLILYMFKMQVDSGDFVNWNIRKQMKWVQFYNYRDKTLMYNSFVIKNDIMCTYFYFYICSGMLQENPSRLSEEWKAGERMITLTRSFAYYGYTDNSFVNV